MKRMVVVCIVISLVVLLSSCGSKAEPFENPSIENYYEFYKAEDYVIYKSSYIDPDIYYTAIGYVFGIDDDTCTVGSFDNIHYLFYYKEEYYKIFEFNKLDIASCKDLRDSGLLGE